MGIGSATRDGVTATINSIGSTVIITSYTQASSDSGYSGQAETTTGTANETAVPFEHFKSILKQKMGDLQEGSLQLALKSTATFDISGSTKYKVTWQGEVHDIIKINRFDLENVLVAWIITLSRRID
jgi:hypothetical protein